MGLFETIGIFMVVSLGVLATVHYGKIPYGNWFDVLLSGKAVESVKRARADAQLVVVGKLVGMRDEIRQNVDRGDDVMMLHGAWTLEIEAVERGSYPGKKIDFLFGWKSNRAAPQEFPAGIRKTYKNGDRVRVFLEYGVPGRGRNEPCYFTHYAYYCLEPLDF